MSAAFLGHNRCCDNKLTPAKLAKTNVNDSTENPNAGDVCQYLWPRDEQEKESENSECDSGANGYGAQGRIRLHRPNHGRIDAATVNAKHTNLPKRVQSAQNRQ